MRYILSILIMISSLACSACSYNTDFVVINGAESPIEVSYKVKGPPNGRPEIGVTPAVKSASQLKSSEKNEWRDLAADRYKIDQANRTVIVELQPQEALFLTRMHSYTGPDDPHDVTWFPIEELNIAGSNGSLKASGKQMLRAFSKQSIALYTLTYQ